MNVTRSSGFTLFELLVSMTVLAVLAAITFPVFRSGIQAAKKSACMQNMRQVGGALNVYLVDYDDRMPPVTYTEEIPGNSTVNRSWVQNLVPYVGTLANFYCPGDVARRADDEVPRSFEASTDPGEQFFESSIRTNFGFNYLYLSPLLRNAQLEWKSYPVKFSRIRDASSTLAFVDSVWDRDESGRPFGGGSFVVIPPCRYTGTRDRPIDTFEFPPDTKLYFGPSPEGWHDTSEKDWLAFGGAWPWHTEKFNVLYLDGRAKAVSVGQLIAGCDFLPNWKGLITSREEYTWDLD